jgi:hypothetical protein
MYSCNSSFDFGWSSLGCVNALAQDPAISNNWGVIFVPGMIRKSDLEPFSASFVARRICYNIILYYIILLFR